MPNQPPWAGDGALSILRAAVQAPSSLNTQPWRFGVRDQAIDVHADHRRALPVNDPDHRELTISCGCALFNARISAAKHGLPLQIRYFPDPDRPSWLARLALDGAGESSAPGELYSAIERRHTVRQPFASTPVGEDVVEELAGQAQSEGVQAYVPSTPDERRTLADLVVKGDQAQWSNAAWRAELAEWMRPPGKGDGLAVPKLAAPIAHAAVRWINLGRRISSHDKRITESAPMVLILSTAADRPRNWLAAGQGLQRMLLAACQRGLQASYLNQPVQVAALRTQVQDVTGQDYPQVIVCLGDPARELPPTPRRPLRAVIEPVGASSKEA